VSPLAHQSWHALKRLQDLLLPEALMSPEVLLRLSA
jgi:hypothetical protein